MRQLGRIGGSIVLGACASFSAAQSFISLDIDGENLRTGQRGHAISAEPGDVIRVAVLAVHDGFSYGGGRFDVLLDGVVPGDIGELQEDGELPPGDPWSVGRTPVTMVNSEAPDGVGGVISARPDAGLYGVDTVITDDELDAKSTGWFDLYTTPPGLGGFVGPFPIESGDRLFVFEYEFAGGEDAIGSASEDLARLWRDQNDVNGRIVPFGAGEGLTVLQACAADLDGDGDADADDFFAYLDAFAAGELGVCDVDEDGDCDADDFFLYLDFFAAGC